MARPRVASPWIGQAGQRRALQLLAVAALLLVALTLLAGCTRDKSWLTSPSAKALLGVTTPALLAFDPTELPPDPVPAPAGWRLTVDLARFGELEGGTPALAILLDIESEPGASMDLWLSDGKGVIARWSGGSTDTYRGDACFQLPLVSEDEHFALPLAGTTDHTITVTFRDDTGRVILSSTRGIASNIPQLEGTPGGEVFRTLLACP